MSRPGPLASHSPRTPEAWRAFHATLIAALWIMLWIVMTLVEIAPAIHDPRVPVWQPIVALIVPAAVISAWLAWEMRSGMYERPELDPPPRWFAHHLWRLPIFVVLSSGSILGMWHVIFIAVGKLHLYMPLQVLVPWEIFKASLMYLLWLGLIYGVLTLTRWREDTERMLGVQKALAEAQLAQLRGQLRPHFIFNALNTVSSLMHTDVPRADRVLAQLGDLLRASLRTGPSEEVSLKEELALLEHYASIMRERFDGRVNFDWKVAEETLPARVPAMLLQPILENAFKHGVERSSAAERITIRTARKGEELRIDIHNTGPRLTNGAAGGLGLQNCRERLFLLYDTEASLVVSDGEGGGVLASVTLPWRASAS